MNEREIVETIVRLAGKGSRLADFNDDVARLEVTAGRPTIITTDMLVETVHFLPDDPAGSVARKLVRVNVSDILAKGACPAEALLVLGWPRGRTGSDVTAFAEALGDELSHWGAQLVGGDTVHSPGGLFVGLTLTGVCEAEAPVRRDGGAPGDSVWVTGTIGAAALGLAEVRSGNVDGPHVGRYRLPELPGLAVAGLIARFATASMDVSDGLLGDAAMLARASGCGIAIDLDDVPYAVPGSNRDAKIKQATGGDDYQCLFTVSQAAEPALKSAAEQAQVRITCVGVLKPDSGLSLSESGKAIPLPERLAYSH
ncbi:MAG: thiamine-phosphate kinase [Pseudomonadota bacterium]